MDRREFIGSAGLALLAAAVPRVAQAAAAGNAADKHLATMVEGFFQRQLDDSPEYVTSLGLDKGARAAAKSKLDGYSKAEQARILAEDKASLDALRKLDRAALSPGQQLNYDVVVYIFEQVTKGGSKYPYGRSAAYYVPYTICQLNGPHYGIPDFLDSQHVIETASDADAYVARLREFARTLDEATRFQQDDVRFGAFAPDFCLDLTMSQLRALRGRPAAETVLVESVVRRTKAKGLTGNWGTDAENIVNGEVFPALDRQISLIAGLRRAATHDAGCWRLPKGDEYYADALINATTTTRTPEEVHQMGLDQVADISAQIDDILKKRGLTQGGVGERLTALGKDPTQVFANTDAGRAELIGYINELVKRIEAKLPQAFATLPKAQLEVKRVPPFIQDGAPNGYYNSAALDGSRGAIYYINLKDTAEWPRYGLATLTHHEGVPGHHLQISLAQEAKDLPMLRRNAPFGAYIEGWALYAEQLADELGVYAEDPLGRVGFLQSFLFRAVRLVVDTGMHHKRWSREQATAYMVEKLGYAQGKAQREIDRYCVWPGQACSYKVGHMSWIKAREKARAIQGAKFDLRHFHDVLLEGAMPLTILENLAEARARE